MIFFNKTKKKTLTFVTMAENLKMAEEKLAAIPLQTRMYFV